MEGDWEKNTVKVEASMEVGSLGLFAADQNQNPNRTIPANACLKSAHPHTIPHLPTHSQSNLFRSLLRIQTKVFQH